MSPPLHHMFAGAPAPVAPFSHACEADGWIFITGQLPIDPGHESSPIPDGIEAQTRKTFDNLLVVLKGLNLSLSDVVSVRAFLTHFYDDYERFNALYAAYFADNKFPARTCIGVTGLARHARVEIDMIARRPG